MDATAKSFYTTVLIISVVLGVIILYFIISILRQQRRNLTLYKQSVLTEITTLEKERSRIANDLHDEIGPMLSAVKLRISSLDVSSEDDLEQVKSTSEHIDSLIKRMREISFDLMPNTLVRKGLVVAIREFIEYCATNNNLQITLKADQNVELDEQRSINLYRMVQEVVHNAMRHSGATRLEIELKKTKKGIVLETHDNGKGFVYDRQASESSGFGLRNLLRRTEIMGGKMFVESTGGKGTSYTFELPEQHA
jgi:signal transduction histidine kinase